MALADADIGGVSIGPTRTHLGQGWQDSLGLLPRWEPRTLTEAKSLAELDDGLDTSKRRPLLINVRIAGTENCASQIIVARLR